MKKLSQLLESINEVNSLLELDFKDKEAFQKYQAIHKMKPTTKVNIAGKDTTVGDEIGDDSEKPQAPKKTTGADIEKQASKSGKEKSDIEKDIMGDEPKSDEPKKLSSRAKETMSDIDNGFEPNYGLSDLVQQNDNKIRNKVVKNVKYPEEFNGYIRRLYAELEESGVSQEELSTLEGLELSDEILELSDVPKDELVSKTKQLQKFMSDVKRKDKMANSPKFDKSKSLFSQVSDEDKSMMVGDVEDINDRSGLDTIYVDKAMGGSGTYYNNIALPALKRKFPDGGYEFYEGIDGGVDAVVDALAHIKDEELKEKLENEVYQISNDMQEELGEEYQDAANGVGKLPYKKMLPYLKRLDRFKKEHFSDVPKFKNENFDLRELSKITTRYTNRLDEAGVSNHLRANFKKLKNVEGLSIEEKDELTDAYRKLVDLLTYGKFYENGRPNQRRKELSELTFDIQYALVGSKRLKPQNSQTKFESIWKKFTNMINTQIKIEEKGKQGNYRNAIRASKLDDVVDIFKRNTQRSTRKQKDLL